MDEVEEKWLVDCSVKLEQGADGIQLQSQVVGVNSDEEKEVEIAVTRQDLVVKEAAGETISSQWEEVCPLKDLAGTLMSCLTSKVESSRTLTHRPYPHTLRPFYPTAPMLPSRDAPFPA